MSYAKRRESTARGRYLATMLRVSRIFCPSFESANVLGGRFFFSPGSLSLYRADTSFAHTLHRAAVEWFESFLADPKNKPAAERPEPSNRNKLKRMQSNLSGSTLTIWRRMGSFFGDDDAEDPRQGAGYGGGCERWRCLAVFTAGLSMGVLVTSRMSSARRI